MFSPLTRAIAQLDDPAILRVLLGSLVLSAAIFGVLCAGSAWGLHHAFAAHSWLAWLAGALGGFAVLASAVWLFLPACVLIASLFMEPVCRAVERRWYPALPRPHGANLGAQLWDAALVALLVGTMNLVSVILALILPGVGLVLGLAVTAWALGRGLFVAVAMRRMDRPAAHEVYRQNYGAVLLQGAALAVAGYIPLVNLLVPVLGTACMVHVLMRQGAPARMPESWG